MLGETRFKCSQSDTDPLTITVVEQNINIINLENVKVNARLIETGIWETER